MKLDRMIELLEAEHECMLRKSHGDCDSRCEACNLVQDDGELNEMYTKVIKLLKARTGITTQDLKDLELVRRVRAGKVKVAGCTAYTIINGDYYWRHRGEYPWKDGVRLLTVADFENNPDADSQGFLPCWVECNDKEIAFGIKAGLIEDGETLDGWTEVTVDEMPGGEHHNPNVRYWTGKPTDKQMRETAWAIGR